MLERFCRFIWTRLNDNGLKLFILLVFVFKYQLQKTLLVFVYCFKTKYGCKSTNRTVLVTAWINSRRFPVEFCHGVAIEIVKNKIKIPYNLTVSPQTFRSSCGTYLFFAGFQYKRNFLQL